MNVCLWKGISQYVELGAFRAREVEITRRVRSLGLGDSVRSFNDLEVPGIGGVWFGRQLILPLLGIKLASLAERRGQSVTNIEAANAVEALACLISLSSNIGVADARVKGRNKFQSVIGKFSNLRFSKVRKKSFYVTQPMRMATTTVLPSLGLVEGGTSRFNSFVLSKNGITLLNESISSYRPGNKNLIDYLDQWVEGKQVELNSKKLLEGLSPTYSSNSSTNGLIREYLMQGLSQPEAQRRQQALRWVEDLRSYDNTNFSLSDKPKQLSVDHWHDIQAGTAFFKARDRALEVLNIIESIIGSNVKRELKLIDENISADVRIAIGKSRLAAEEYLNLKHRDEGALRFCSELAHLEDLAVVESLVARDGNVLQLNEKAIIPASAFSGHAYELPTVDNENEQFWPLAISFRIKNLFLLNSDLNGSLEKYIGQVEVEGSE
jgi:hypothetical protein